MIKTQNMEFVHHHLYGQALSVLKNFVSQSETRPVLQYARHTEDGDAFATDSHRAIQIKNIHGYQEEFLVHPKSGTLARGGNYPDITQLINREEGLVPIFKLNNEQVKVWLQVFKSIIQTLKVMKEHYRPQVIMRFKGSAVRAAYSSQLVLVHLPCEVIGSKENLEEIILHPGYMKDLLDAHQKLESKEVTFYIDGPLKPIASDDGERVRTLLLPIRTY